MATQEEGKRLAKATWDAARWTSKLDSKCDIGPFVEELSYDRNYTIQRIILENLQDQGYVMVSTTGLRKLREYLDSLETLAYVRGARYTESDPDLVAIFKSLE